MSSLTFQSNPTYIKLVDLLHQLHFLMRDGKDDEEGDRVRDAMDPLWYKLSAEEQERINGMSADLKTLEPECPFKHSNDRNVLDPALGADLRACVEAEDWEHLLGLLRERDRAISWDRAAPIRGDAYSKLGEFATAVLFFTEAVQLSPENAALKLALADSLEKCGRTVESDVLRDNLLSNADVTPPEIVVPIAFEKASKLLRVAAESSVTRLRSLTETFDKVLARLHRERAVGSKEFAYSAIGRAMCLKQVGDDSAAVEAISSAIEQQKTNPELRSFRALIRLPNDKSGAIADFQEAIDLRTTEFWPFFFLAEKALREKDYSRCISLCLAGLNLCHENEIRAEFYEWLAIAHFELGATEEADVGFRRASELSLYNERIQQNVEMSRKLRGMTSSQTTHWNLGNSPREVGFAQLIRSALSSHGEHAALSFR